MSRVARDSSEVRKDEQKRVSRNGRAGGHRHRNRERGRGGVRNADPRQHVPRAERTRVQGHGGRVRADLHALHEGRQGQRRHGGQDGGASPEGRREGLLRGRRHGRARAPLARGAEVPRGGRDQRRERAREGDHPRGLHVHGGFRPPRATRGEGGRGLDRIARSTRVRAEFRRLVLPLQPHRGRNRPSDDDLLLVSRPRARSRAEVLRDPQPQGTQVHGTRLLVRAGDEEDGRQGDRLLRGRRPAPPERTRDACRR